MQDGFWGCDEFFFFFFFFFFDDHRQEEGLLGVWRSCEFGFYDDSHLMNGVTKRFWLSDALLDFGVIREDIKLTNWLMTYVTY